MRTLTIGRCELGSAHGFCRALSAFRCRVGRGQKRDYRVDHFLLAAATADTIAVLNAIEQQ